MQLASIPDMIILLASAVAIVSTFRAMRASPVLGYLVAGAVIGPDGMAIISDLHTTEAIAEFGIVFLLFMIGLELSFDRLKSMRKKVFGIGTAQVLTTGLILFLVALGLGKSAHVAILIGGGLALSSTALVLQVLQQRRELSSQTGRLALAILILQDLAVLPLLVLVTALANGSESLGAVLGMSALRGFVVLVVITVLGRVLLRPLFRAIAQLDIHELFVAVTLLVVIGLAYITELAGLSMALGAFLAGLLLAETEFRPQIEADVMPYKSLLMGLFFMTVGMKIDAQFILDHLLEILLGSAALIAMKAAALYGVLRAFRYTKSTSGHTALLLAQGGEFGFILFGLAGELGVLNPSVVKELLLVITMTMAATPLLDALGQQLERRRWSRVRAKPDQIQRETQDMHGHVVIAGYGRMGQLMAEYLQREKIAFIGLDTNPREVAAGRKRHHPVFFGNAAQPEVLEATGIGRADALVITLHQPEAATHLLQVMRHSYPTLPILVRAHDFVHQRELERHGATWVVPELEVSGKRLFAQLLSTLGQSEEEIRRTMQRLKGKVHA